MSEPDPPESVFDFESFDLGLFARVVKASNPAAGWHLLLHGLGDHSGGHTWAASILAGTGAEVVAIDWPGCGKSGSPPGELPTVEEAVRYIDTVIERKGSPPCGIFAHSTGCFFLMRWLLERREEWSLPRWVWFSSPLISPQHGQSTIKIVAARLAVKLHPRFTLSTGVTPAQCYHGGKDSPGGWDDPLYHDRVSLRAGDSLLQNAEVVQTSYGRFPETPSYLIVQGWEDPVCPPSFSRTMFTQLSGRDKVYLLVHDARHEPFKEKAKEPLTNAVRAWLRSRNL